MAWLTLIGAVLRLLSTMAEAGRARRWLAQGEADRITEDMRHAAEVIVRMQAARRAALRLGADPRLLRRADDFKRPD